MELSEMIDNGDLKVMLLNMQATFLNRLRHIEEKMEIVSTKYRLLERKVDNILGCAKEATLRVPHSKPQHVGTDPSYLMAANERECYPYGSWLGDPNNTAFRVRCQIAPNQLERLNKNCATADKMALKLLDYLFDRETQASSNISGTGKYGKNQLDPLKIFGIKCHVMYKFGTNNKEWKRIKLNLDSKCRFAFRRKMKNLHLFADNSEGKSEDQQGTDAENSTVSALLSSCEQSMVVPKAEASSSSYLEDCDLSEIIPLKFGPDGCSLTLTNTIGSQVIHSEHGEIQVIEATEEELEELKQNYQIEILPSADITTESILDST